MSRVPDTPEWRTFRELDPRSFKAYQALVEAPWKNGPLPPKVKEFIGIVADGTVSGPYAPGLKDHVARAVAVGATRAELVEVFELMSVIGIHTSVVTTPVLLEELERAGKSRPDATSPRAREVRALFEKRRGYWSPLWEAIAAVDPDFLEAYVEYSSIPAEHGPLDAKTREFVLIALSAVTTHLFPEGARVHIRNALAAGATAAEIMEIFELLGAIGVRAFLVGLPAMLEETGG